MSNYNSAGTFSPMIPRHLINENDIEVFRALNILMEPGGKDDHGNDLVYLCNEECCSCGTIATAAGEEKELESEDLYESLQGIIKRSEGLLSYITHEQAHTCSKVSPDSHGGSAVFITADEIRYTSTSDWLYKQQTAKEQSVSNDLTRDDLLEVVNDLVKAGKLLLERCEQGDIGEAVRNLESVIDFTEYSLENSTQADNKQTLCNTGRLHELILDLFNSADNCGCEHPYTVCNEEDLLAVYNESKKLKNGTKPAPNLVITVAGGVVQSVVSDTPDAFRGCKIALVDYDHDNGDPHDDRIGICCDKEGGNLEPAYMALMEVEQASIDTSSVFGFLAHCPAHSPC